MCAAVLQGSAFPSGGWRLQPQPGEGGRPRCDGCRCACVERALPCRLGEVDSRGAAAGTGFGGGAYRRRGRACSGGGRRDGRRMRPGRCGHERGGRGGIATFRHEGVARRAARFRRTPTRRSGGSTTLSGCRRPMWSAWGRPRWLLLGLCSCRDVHRSAPLSLRWCARRCGPTPAAWWTSRRWVRGTRSPSSRACRATGGATVKRRHCSSPPSRAAVCASSRRCSTPARAWAGRRCGSPSTIC